MHAACHSYGIVASVTQISNYKRIWTRDSVICGLMGWIIKDQKISDSLKMSILQLAKHQGPNGEIPSNIELDEKLQVINVSYGSTVGRIDTLGWFVIGAIHVLKAEPDLEKKLMPVIKKALKQYNCLEMNLGGLVYVPQGGNWADDYNVEGYLLYDQLVRLWALRCYEKYTQVKSYAKKLEELIQIKFWQNEKEFWLCGYKPGSHDERFDFFAHILTWLLKLNTKKQMTDTIKFISEQRVNNTTLIPAFSPVVKEVDNEYSSLLNMAGPEFKNFPHCYHNGGVWPMLNGLWGLALYYNNLKEESEKICKDLVQVISANNYRFQEYFHGVTLEGEGTEPCAWSAATPLALYNLLNKKTRRLIC